MYHRIDGRLVAVGEIDLLDSILHSGYFIYDPDFSFLHLGVVGAIMEL
jgi:arginyl-tRNA--protein-N-Asp/Glu arginylyltransferase